MLLLTLIHSGFLVFVKGPPILAVLDMVCAVDLVRRVLSRPTFASAAAAGATEWEGRGVGGVREGGVRGGTCWGWMGLGFKGPT